MKGYEWRLSLAKDRAVAKQKLYAEFVTEAHRLTTQGREERITSLADLNNLNCKFEEVSLIGSEDVIAKAKLLKEYALSSQPVPTAKEANDFFVRKASFIEAARRDIECVLEKA